MENWGNGKGILKKLKGETWQWAFFLKYIPLPQIHMLI